jgi:uncharacterized protein (DUF1810 family)
MPTEADRHHLERFVTAQNDGGTYGRAVAELRAGAKRSHWMWFIFPQIEGLGRSAVARTYAIASLPEAIAYVAHPVLGPRLLESTAILLGPGGRSAEEIFGGIDSLKLRSSMTLFARAAPDRAVFQQVIDRYFDGEPDAATDRILASRGRSGAVPG